MWRSTAPPFVGYRPSGIADRLLGQGRTRRPHAFEQRGLPMILGMSVGAFTILHVIITLVAIGSGLIVVGGMSASNTCRSQPHFFSHNGAHQLDWISFPIHGFTPALGV